MKMRNITIFTTLIASLTIVTATTTAAPAEKPNLLSIRDTISDDNIVYPESFQTDTEKLLQNWYLQNYAILDDDVEAYDTKPVSDDEYIRRLKALPTQIEMPFNSIVRSYIETFVTQRRTLFEAVLGMSLYYMPIIEQALEQEGLPLELRCLPIIESALNPEAVSKAGATGMWQFMLPTAKAYGLEINSLVDERCDPYAASTAAARFLKELYEIYGDWSLSIAAYNCGPGSVNKAIIRAGHEGQKCDFWDIYSFLPEETRGYVPAFIAANYVMTYFKAHNISPALARKPIITDTVNVDRRLHFNQISAVLDIPIEALRVLNPQYRQDIIPGSSERQYVLTLPSRQVYSYLLSADSIATYDQDLYAQRGVVEPVETVVDTPETKTPVQEYTYENRLVTKYYKVKRGDNLSKIAQQFGVTVDDIVRTNNKKNTTAQLGETLKINVYERVKVPVVADDQPDGLGQGDKTVEPQTPSASTKSSKTKSSKTKSSQNKPRKHKVKKGESLSKIAAKYKGVSVDDIKKANNLTGNSIQAGQTLIIPTK